MSRRVLLVFGILALMAVAPVAMAQYGEEHDHGELVYDATVAPLVVPTSGDFLLETGETGEDDAAAGDDSGKSADKVGLNTYIDVTENMKAGVLTPFYRFSPKFAGKAHVPLIWSRKMNYPGFEAEGKGLGDITLDGEYTHALATPGALLRFSGSVTLPTGDDENVDTDEYGSEYAVPLGSGTTSYTLKGQYAKSTPKRGLLFGLMYRKNSPSESSVTYGSPAVTQTTKVTAASQIVGSAFARQRVSRNWYVHLGATAMKLGSGKSETEYSDGTPTVDNGADMGGTLLDIYPGVSYALGKFNPFLGVRIPVSTSWDNEFRSDERDTSFIFQFSYRPESLNK